MYMSNLCGDDSYILFVPCLTSVHGCAWGFVYFNLHIWQKERRRDYYIGLFNVVIRPVIGWYDKGKQMLLGIVSYILQG